MTRTTCAVLGKQSGVPVDQVLSGTDIYTIEIPTLHLFSKNLVSKKGYSL